MKIWNFRITEVLEDIHAIKGNIAHSVAFIFFFQIVSVSEAWIAIAILRLIENEKAVVEGAGAVGLAAILAGLLPELKGKKWVAG